MCNLSFRFEKFVASPHPCLHVQKLGLMLMAGRGHALPTGLEDRPLEGDARGSRARRRSIRPGRPHRLVRSVVASRLATSEFGLVVAQAAWARNFFAAQRRAFLGDGQAAKWIQIVWSGQVETILPELESRLAASCARTEGV